MMATTHITQHYIAQPQRLRGRIVDWPLRLRLVATCQTHAWRAEGTNARRAAAASAPPPPLRRCLAVSGAAAGASFFREEEDDDPLIAPKPLDDDAGTASSVLAEPAALPLRPHAEEGRSRAQQRSKAAAQPVAAAAEPRRDGPAGARPLASSSSSGGGGGGGGAYRPAPARPAARGPADAPGRSASREQPTAPLRPLRRRPAARRLRAAPFAGVIAAHGDAPSPAHEAPAAHATERPGGVGGRPAAQTSIRSSSSGGGGGGGGGAATAHAAALNPAVAGRFVGGGLLPTLVPRDPRGGGRGGAASHPPLAPLGARELLEVLRAMPPPRRRLVIFKSGGYILSEFEALIARSGLAHVMRVTNLLGKAHCALAKERWADGRRVDLRQHAAGCAKRGVPLLVMRGHDFDLLAAVELLRPELVRLGVVRELPQKGASGSDGGGAGSGSEEEEEEDLRQRR